MTQDETIIIKKKCLSIFCCNVQGLRTYIAKTNKLMHGPTFPIVDMGANVCFLLILNSIERFLGIKIKFLIILCHLTNSLESIEESSLGYTIINFSCPGLSKLWNLYLSWHSFLLTLNTWLIYKRCMLSHRH